MANFSANTLKGCSPVLVSFTDNSTGNIAKWDWDLGNGNKSVLKNPSAIYITPGLYTISLIVEDNNGIKDTIVKYQYIEVFKNPIADFSASTLEVCPYELIQFENKSEKGTGDITSYTWDFGNGVTSNEKSPTHFYTSSGLIDITLIVKDENGCESVKRINRYIKVFPSPEPNFVADKTIGCENPLTVKFTYTGSQGIISYSWNFGDGNASINKDPQNTYTSKGDFDVSLTVVDTNGCEKTIQKPVFIKTRDIDSDFEMVSISTCFEEPVSFKNLSTSNLEGLSYIWDFGNGRSSTEKNPEETYQSEGVYKVRLIAYVSGAACADTMIKDILVKIHPKPTVYPIVNDSLYCNSPVQVFFKPSEPVLSAFWRFSNIPSDISTLKEPNKFYTQPGEYDVIYEFIDTNGCKIRDTLKKRIDIEYPKIEFNGPLRGCVPLTANFSATLDSKFPNFTYKWFVDNVQVSTSASFSHTFTEAKNGVIRVEVTNGRGCKYVTERAYSYGEKTNPDFDFSDSVICVKEPVYFTNLTDNSDGKVTRVLWKFTPGDTSNRWHDYHIYKTLGYKTVELITFNFGCSDTMKKELIIKVDGPLAGVSYKFENCSGKVRVTNTSGEFTRFRWTIADTLVDSTTSFFDFDMEGAADSLKVKIWVANDSNKCKNDSMTIKIPPFHRLKANFVHDDEYCAPATIRFYNASTSNLHYSTDRFFWYINDKEIPQYRSDSVQEYSSLGILNYQIGVLRNVSPSLRFEKPGTYSVKIMSRRSGCQDTFSKEIIIPGPDLEVDFTQDKICLPVTVNLKVKNFDSTYKVLVNMGDGSFYNLRSSEMDYVYKNGSNVGRFVIYYNIEDSNKCKNYERFEVLVSGPNVTFSNTNKYTCDSANIEFSPRVFNSQSQNFYTYAWDMGDGTKKSKDTIKHLYKDSGNYFVQLKVTDAFGCVGEYSKNVFFAPSELKANIFADTVFSPCPPLLVNFRSESKSKSGVAIVSYYWDFGDNTFSSQINPRKTYTQPGRYTVRLTVVDALGCTDVQELPELVVIEGPVGQYSFTPNLGCMPLAVTFSASSMDPTNKFFWDLGDGSSSNEISFVKTYPNAGIYTPLLIITDTNGCSYTLPPKGPITVHPLPIANFSSAQYCYNSPTIFKGTSFGNGNLISETRWKFEDEVSIVRDPIYQFKTPGEKVVRLIVKTQNGCLDTIEKNIKIYGFEPYAYASPEQVCLGDQITLVDLSKSDTTIILSQWLIGENIILQGKSMTYTPTEKGWFGVTLYLQNSLLCDTTIYLEDVVIIGDTVPSKPNDMLHVSVVNDKTMQVKYLKSVESDFMKYHLYELDSTGIYKKVKEVGNVNDTLVYLDDYNPLYNVYCFTVVQENVCGYTAIPNEGIIHCSVELSGESDTNASILHWNAYSGWDEVERYVIYKQNIEDINHYDSIGQVPGDVFTFIDSLVCFTDLFSYKVQAIEKGGYFEKSWSDSCRVKPIYWNHVPSPYILFTSVPDNHNTELEWVSPVPSRKPIVSYVIERSTNDVRYTFLDTMTASNYMYYYDESKTNVQQFNYHYKVKAVDECGDLSDYSNLAKTVLLKSELSNDFKPLLYWTKYKEWEEGVDYYIIEHRLTDGSFEEIARTNSGEDTFFIHQTVQINCRPEYIYRVIAVRKIANAESIVNYTDIVSVSNHTEVPVVSKLFAPNAFSPNGDGLNEVFESKGIYIKEFNIKVFNRWGEKLFDSNDCLATWDGTFMGEPVQQDVYVYIIQAIGVDGKMHSIKQTVTLLR